MAFRGSTCSWAAAATAIVESVPAKFKKDGGRATAEFGLV